MPASTTNLLNVPQTASPTSDLQGVNNQTKTTQQRANTPWTLRIAQTVHAQSLPYNTFTQIGFDTLDYVTYRSIAQAAFSLQFIPATIGGNLYPVSTISMPQYGYYQVTVAILMGMSGAGAYVNSVLRILVNGSSHTQTYNNGSGDVGMSFQTVSASDLFLMNPQDQLSFSFDQVNPNSANLTTEVSGGDTINYAVIRYLGLN